MESMAKLYACLYTQWSQQRYEQLVQRAFPIDPKRKLSTCSKGDAPSNRHHPRHDCMPKYLLLDEAFDGLDRSSASLCAS